MGARPSPRSHETRLRGRQREGWGGGRLSRPALDPDHGGGVEPLWELRSDARSTAPGRQCPSDLWWREPRRPSLTGPRRSPPGSLLPPARRAGRVSVGVCAERVCVSVGVGVRAVRVRVSARVRGACVWACARSVGAWGSPGGGCKTFFTPLSSVRRGDRRRRPAPAPPAATPTPTPPTPRSAKRRPAPPPTSTLWLRHQRYLCADLRPGAETRAWEMGVGGGADPSARTRGVWDEPGVVCGVCVWTTCVWTV